MPRRAPLPALRAAFVALSFLAPLALLTAGPLAALAPSDGPISLAPGVPDPVWDGAAAKLDRSLTDAVAAARAGRPGIVDVAIRSRGPIDLDGIAAKWVSTTWPLGGVVTLARLDLRALPKVASIEAVDLVEDAAHPVMATDEFREPDQRLQPDASALRRRLAALRAADVPFSDAPPLATGKFTDGAVASDGPGAEAAPGSTPAGGAAPDAWFDVTVGHGSARAWAKGWRGQGVRAGVSDSGVDFSTPALQGTWAVIDDPASPYNGWPQALDAQGLYLYVQDAQLGSANTALGVGGVVATTQTSRATRSFDELGEPVGRACFRRVLAGNVLDDAPVCNYRVPYWTAASRRGSRSGIYRFGLHPDPNLVSLYNERPGILLVDETTAGVYDTVYVDLDNDHDFTDEKPVTKASPLAYRDMDGDGWVDLSGGLLYWIADGVTPVPGAYLWGDLAPLPAAGDVVAFIGTFSGHHGNECASDIAGQGVVPVPAGINLRFRDLPGDGTPDTLLIGAAPGAKVVAIRRGGTLVSESTYIYAAFGHEKDRQGDELQVLSNSYRLENHFHEGWDYTSRLVDYLTTVNPNISYLWSSGNGGPGYGSIRDPNPKSGIKVAASTQMGSTGYDSITETTQITWGDLISFSSFGPGSDGTIGPHVAASGAYATGAVGVNARLDGRLTTVTWGGTSRSTPVAAGNLALVYQAFKEKSGRWPTWREARSILMAGAQFMGYDPYLYGAGVLDGGASAFIAGGAGGVYAMPAILNPGDYRGTTYAAFPSMTAPGSAEAMELNIINPSPEAVELTLQGQRPRMVGTHEFTWQSKGSASESRYYYHDPDYVIPIPRDVIPAGTDMMAIRMILPLEDMDLGLNYRGGSDNIWYMRAYQHTDIDGDGVWWTDADGDGIVDHGRLSTSSQLDGIADPDWTVNELDRWEYMRIGQDTAPTNNKLLWIHHPLDRWADGLYIGLTHASRPSARPVTSMRFRLEFYRYEDWPWIDIGEESVTIPGGGSASVPVIVYVPEDADYGYHQGAVFGIYSADDPDARPYRRLTVPVQVNVGASVDAGGTGASRYAIYLPVADVGASEAASSAAGGRPGPEAGAGSLGAGGRAPGGPSGPGGQPAPNPGQRIVLGGEGAQDAADPYANGLVRGLNRWGYSAESGDWRFFMLDVVARPARGYRFVFHSSWDDGKPELAGTGPLPRSDVDTLVYGPASDRWSDPSHPDNAEENLADPATFGPQTVASVGGSVNAYAGSGVWRFDTVTGDYEDLAVAPARAGLHVVMAHNALIAGDRFDVPMSIAVESARLFPDGVYAVGDGCSTISLAPSFEMAGVQAAGYGLSLPVAMRRQVAHQDDPNNPATASWRHTFTVDHGSLIDVSIQGTEADDLDLFLYRDADNNGTYETALGSSTTPTSIERVTLNAPPDGKYLVTVHGWSVPAGDTTFDLDLVVLQGRGVTIDGLPENIDAGADTEFQVCYQLPAGGVTGPGLVRFQGEVILGSEAALGLFRLPVSIAPEG